MAKYSTFDASTPGTPVAQQVLATRGLAVAVLVADAGGTVGTNIGLYDSAIGSTSTPIAMLVIGVSPATPQRYEIGAEFEDGLYVTVLNNSDNVFVTVLYE